MKDLRCLVGLHKPTNVKMETRLHMGMFGGPLTTFRWNCARCGRRGVT